MRIRDYKDICAALEVPAGEYPDMDRIMNTYPSVTYDTLVSIYSQECTRRVAISFRRTSKEDNLARLAKRYLKGEDAVTLSHSVNVPPCVLMRLLLSTILGISKQAVSKCLKDPTYLLDLHSHRLPEGLSDPDLPGLRKRLAADVEHCTAVDNVFSPYVDGLRNTVGREYEAVLEQRLSELGIAYEAEDQLRQKGQAKTPDVKLSVPIAVRRRVVHWIDSKACFCDEWTYQNKGKDQFQSYVNRYGPGMVIYWFGMVDELNDNPDVLLVEDFPHESEIEQLPAMSVDLHSWSASPPMPSSPMAGLTPFGKMSSPSPARFALASPAPTTPFHQ